LQISHHRLELKKKIIVLAATIIISAVLIFANWFLFFGGESFFPGKLEVSDLKIDHSNDWSSCYIRFSVSNFHNSPITTAGARVNGVNYDYSNLTIPPGQTQDASINLNDLIITSSPNYDIEITFTFNDGQYQTYSESVLPPKYVGGFNFNYQTLNVTASNNTVYSVEIKNTGNIPIVSAKYTIDNYESSLPFHGDLMPKNAATFNNQPIPIPFQKGAAYLIIYQVTYADRSIDSARISLSVF
jgi:hypothetical protein